MRLRRVLATGAAGVAALLLAGAVWAASPKEKRVQVTVMADRPEAIYAVGEVARFTIAVTDAEGKPVQTGKVTAVLTPDGGEPLETREITLGPQPAEAGNPATISGTLNAPGFLWCRATYKDDSGEASGLASVGFDPTGIKSAMTMPDDFDAFWAAGKKEAEAVPLDVKLQLLPKYCDDEVDSYAVSFANLENTRLDGYLCVPKGKPGPFPAFVEVPSSGTGKPEKPWPYWARRGALVLLIEVHPLKLVPEKPQVDYRDELEKMYPNHMSYGLPDRNKFYFRRAILGIDRAITWLAARPDFDGKRLVVYGSSQGGWFSFILGTLNPHVTAIAANVPAFCDRTGGGRRGAPTNPEQQRQLQETFTYYDAVNFARRSRPDVPLLVSAGFLDTGCVARGVYAAFNVYRGPKRFENMVRVGHDISPEFEKLLDEWSAGQLGLAPVVLPTKSEAK